MRINLKLIFTLALSVVATAIWAATITVQLRTSGGGTVPDAASAMLKYYDAGWHTATNDGTGTWTVNSAAASVTYKVYYHNGTQQKVEPTTNTTVTFNTVTTTAALKTSSGTPLAGGQYKHYQWGWSGMVDANDPVELLPGNHTFKMYFNNGTQQQNSVAIILDASGAQEVLFTTVTTTAALKTSSGTPLAGGQYKHYQWGWSGMVDANDPVELLPGNHTFKMYFNNGTQQQNSVAIILDASGAQEILFTTVTTTAALKTSSGTPLAGGQYKHYQWGWSGMVDANDPVELLPGNHTFKMYFNNGTQQQNSVAIILDASGAQEVLFTTVTTTAALKTSSGTPLAGGQYKHYQWGWSGMVDANDPVELLPGNHTFKMYFNNGTQQQNSVAIVLDASGAQEVLFTTVTVDRALENCDGADLAGGTVKHYQWGWSPSGAANIPVELLPGNYTFKMYFNNGTKQQNSVAIVLDASGAQQVLFQATKVEFAYPGTVKHYQNGWGTYTFGKYLLPGNYTFKFYSPSGNYSTSVVISGCTMTSTVAILKLKDHSGGALSGGTARGGNGASFSQWFVPGSTNSSGILFDFHAGIATTRSYEMKYNNTTAHKTQDMTVNAVFEFQTELITMRLETCGGAPLDGANVRYGKGATFTTWWFPTNPTGSSAPGETTAEFFPGTYSFEAQYQGTRDQKISFDFPGDGNTVTWQTTSVTLQYSGQISYGGASGDSRFFNKPSMELLAGTYKFHFRSGYRTDLTIAGCSMTKSAAVVKLIDSGGSGLAGGVAKINLGGWQTLGTTGADGCVIALIDGLIANKKYRMEYAGHANEKYQDISTNSVVVFQTTLVTMKLVESDGTTELNGTAKYNGSGWKSFGSGTTTTTMELLPNNIKFRVEHAGLANEKYQDISIDPVVVFQTTLVTMKLVESDGTTELNGTAKYNGSGWKSFGSGTTTTTMELLPNNIKFRVEHAGLANEKYQDISIDPVVVFQTTLVTMKLVESDGTTELNGTAKYNGSGWKSFGSGTTTTTMELLPNNIKFRVEHAGLANEKYQDISIDPVVVFQTTLVTMKLVESDGTTELNGTAKYNGSGWKSFGSGTTTTTMELLPNNIKFRVEHAGLANEKYQDISIDPVVVFQTTLVTMQLLDGATELAGTSKYNGGGWKTFGSGTTTTTMELLPNNIKFRVEYSGTAAEKYQNVSVDPVVIFNYSGGSISRSQDISGIEAIEEGLRSVADPQTETGDQRGLTAESDFELGQNYPNPFVESTTIDYTIPNSGHVQLLVYNSNGQVVATLVDEFKDAGRHQVRWDQTANSGSQGLNGVYYYTIKIGEHFASKSLMILK